MCEETRIPMIPVIFFAFQRTALNLRKFSYTGLSFLSLSAKSKAKSVFVVDKGE